MGKCFLCFILMLSFNLRGQNYYVSGSGNDTNDGLTTTTAFRNIQKAADLVKPGGTVYVMNGLYNERNSDGDILTIFKSGTPTKWITFKNYENDTPKITFNNWAGINIQPGAAYIEISGFDVEGNNNNETLEGALNQYHSCNNPGNDNDPYQPEFNGNGINADGRYSSIGYDKPHHLKFTNNQVHDCGGGGINIIQCDYVTVKNNVVYNNAWYTIYGSSGINMYQNWNSDNNRTKYKMIVDGNICFGNKLLVPAAPNNQCLITDGNGIIIDDSDNTQSGSQLGIYNGKTLVQNNLIYNNGGAGIQSYYSQHVTILNNTAYKNSQSVELTEGQIFASSSNDTRIINNIMVAADDDDVINSNDNSTNVIYKNNLHFNGNTITLNNSTCVNSDPLFVDEANFDFHLKDNSPAINAGNTNIFSALDLDWNPRTNPDIGAFEYGNFNNKYNKFQNAIKVYPNPAHEKMTFESPEKVDKIICIDVLGEKTNLKFANNTIDLSSFKTGVYQLLFYEGDSFLKSISIIKN